MRNLWLITLLALLAACRIPDEHYTTGDDGGPASGLAPPRLIAPLSMSTVSLQKTDSPLGTRERDWNYFGSAAPSEADWNGGSLTGRIDLASPDVFASFGNSVASAGDVNGDGYADFLIGSDAANSAGGTAHLYLGSMTPSASAWNKSSPTERIDLADPDGASASFGNSVASAGDVNGDGYTDFIVGALTASSNAGAAHLYLGSSAPSAATWNGTSAPKRVDLTNPDGTSALFGSAVASAGDVNGDGYADFLVGSYGAGSSSGAAHVYLGLAVPSAAAWNGTTPAQRINLANPNGASARFGASVASAGDVNGDGYADFLVGASDASSLTGAAQLYLGSMTPSATAWNAATPTGRSDLVNPNGANARFGVSVASAEPRLLCHRYL